ncbi:PAS domain-containing protein [Acidipila sp. EB88]|uniref:PAS domain-containing protein n=1 Tax=Acidipila sp. EB88 TaxID=2305226 RepID=UPI000F5FED56|nr:PAS domain-containing protein [Acidipila sp. EB88]RRA48090.1 PAS domain S-box protein [Acidipila sp. EB88]
MNGDPTSLPVPAAQSLLAPGQAEILDASSDAIATLDRAWNLRYLNRRARELVSASGDVLGKNHWESFPDSLFPGSPWVEHYHRAMDQGVPSGFEAFYPAPLNMWLAIQAMPSADGIIIFFRDITGQKHLQQERDATAARLNQVLAVTTDCVAYIDRQWRITYLNERARQMLVPSGDVLGKNHWESFPAAVFAGSPFVEHYHRAMDQKLPGLFEAFYPAPLNVWLRTEVQPAEDGIVVFFRDVSVQHAEAEERALLTERLQMALHAANNLGSWDWDMPNQRLYADEGLAFAFGVDPAEASSGTSLEAFTRNMHPEDLPLVMKKLRNATRTGEEYSVEYRLRRADGTWRSVQAQGRCTLSPDGGPVRFLGIVLDITSRKESEETLTRREEQLQLAMESAELGMWSFDTEQGVLIADATTQRILNAPVRQGTIDYWLQFIHPEDADRAAIHFDEALAGIRPYQLEYRIVRADGIRWIRSKGRVVGQPGSARRILAIVEDVTEQKQKDEALRNSSERLRLAQQHSKIASWEWDVAAESFLWSEGSAIIYGRPPEELTCLSQLAGYVHEEDREAVTAALDATLQGTGEFQAEFRVCWPDNSVHWIHAHARAILSPGRMPNRLIGISMDVTERKLSEAALLQSEKLAAVGRLASSIAHEINNPLESVTNLLYLLRTMTNDVQREYVEIAERELRRVSVITNQTLRFHKQSTNPSTASCSELIDSALSVYQGKLVNSNIAVEQRKRPDFPILCMDGEIRQVLSNLIGNAIDAMHPLGGRLLLRSRKATDWRTGRQGMRIVVADTGPGMSASTAERVFEAFYTTKGIGGTGLGLWISKEIIDRHRGRLMVRTSQQPLRNGTIFALFLPFAPPH